MEKAEYLFEEELNIETDIAEDVDIIREELIKFSEDGETERMPPQIKKAGRRRAQEARTEGKRVLDGSFT